MKTEGFGDMKGNGKKKNPCAFDRNVESMR